MSAVFADTFYWIALADYTDEAHQRVLALTTERAGAAIVTTDEVLAEYLQVLGLGGEPIIEKAGVILGAWGAQEAPLV